MTRVALVTGGTRGIGAAVARLFKDAGYKVCATCAGNDAAAASFKAETGIMTEKWDACSMGGCADGVARVVKALGPVDVLVNNAGITRDTTFHKMTEQQWDEVLNTNLKS